MWKMLNVDQQKIFQLIKTKRGTIFQLLPQHARQVSLKLVSKRAPKHTSNIPILCLLHQFSRFHIQFEPDVAETYVMASYKYTCDIYLCMVLRKNVLLGFGMLWSKVLEHFRSKYPKI